MRVMSTSSGYRSRFPGTAESQFVIESMMLAVVGRAKERKKRYLFQACSIVPTITHKQRSGGRLDEKTKDHAHTSVSVCFSSPDLLKTFLKDLTMTLEVFVGIGYPPLVIP